MRASRREQEEDSGRPDHPPPRSGVPGQVWAKSSRNPPQLPPEPGGNFRPLTPRLTHRESPRAPAPGGAAPAEALPAAGPAGSSPAFGKEVHTNHFSRRKSVRSPCNSS